MATISIVDHRLPDDTHNLYDVTFFTDEIQTLLTQSPAPLHQWLLETTQQQQSSGSSVAVVVGLDVEWRPNFSRNHNNPIATLQLCVGGRCVIFQLIHSPSIPQSLFDFLQSKDFVFVGVGIESDVEKLVEDYGLMVGNSLDLRGLAAEKLGDKALKNSGLKQLAREVLGKEIEKPKRVSMSRWDNIWLTPLQVQYACIDAFLSYKIGDTLNAGSAVAPAVAPAGGAY
ncbi:3'-5' exonuclease [Linum grandiflorum]